MVLNSELVALLDDDGRRAVLAHEAAHVHSDHVLYQTALLILLQLAPGRCRSSPASRCCAIRSRCSSGSAPPSCRCDRAAALVTRDPLAVCRSLMVLSAGAAAEDLNLDAFITQALRLRRGWHAASSA